MRIRPPHDLAHRDQARISAYEVRQQPLVEVRKLVQSLLVGLYSDVHLYPRRIGQLDHFDIKPDYLGHSYELFGFGSSPGI